MTAAVFIGLLLIFILTWTKQIRRARLLFGLFIILWILCLIPHFIRHINIQL